MIACILEIIGLYGTRAVVSSPALVPFRTLEVIPLGSLALRQPNWDLLTVLPVVTSHTCDTGNPVNRLPSAEAI